MVKSARGGDGDSGKSRGGEAEWTQKIEVKRGEGEWGSRLGSKKPGNTARHDQAVYRRTEGNDPRKNIAGIFFIFQTESLNREKAGGTEYIRGGLINEFQPRIIIESLLLPLPHARG